MTIVIDLTTREKLKAFCDKIERSASTRSRLRAGECLCPQCGRIGQPDWDDTCGFGCTYDNDKPVKAITWEAVQEGLPDISVNEYDWLQREHPELVAEAKATQSLPRNL